MAVSVTSSAGLVAVVAVCRDLARMSRPMYRRIFAHQFIDDGTPPREWAERLYNVRRWTPMPRGGHFPSAEEPDLLSRDIAAFFNDPGAATSPK